MSGLKRSLLGRSGIAISSIGLGCVTFGREIDEDASFAILDHATEAGINWLDTAEAYGGGNARAHRKTALGIDDVREVSNEMGSSECIIGRWMEARRCRNEVVLCSKVSSGNTPENIERALDTTLDRLQTDCVDMYELHAPDSEVPIGETLSALAALIDGGKVRAIGCSNFSAEQLREALQASADGRVPRFEVIQPPYSLASPEAETDLFPLCKAEQIGITTYSPLAAGFLTGKYSPDREAFPEGSRFHISPNHANVYFSERNFRTVARLQQAAEAWGIPVTRLAMAWAMTHPDVTSVIIGARTTDHIDNALSAATMELPAATRATMSDWLVD